MRLDGRIDLLVNNAGFSVAPAGAEESSIEQAQSIFDTNFFGIVRMTRAVVPTCDSQGGGRIINIGSVLGFLPAPYMALYAATKHAIEGYSESLDHELRTRGIRVSVIEPAYTRTQFDANLLEPDAKLDEYREVRAALGKRMKELFAAADQPGVVADVVLKVARAARPKLRYTAGKVAAPRAIASQIRAHSPGGRWDSQRPAARRADGTPMTFKARPATKTDQAIPSCVVEMHEHDGRRHGGTHAPWLDEERPNVKPVCLVIGAGAGIGGTVARRFAREGYHACLCRRSDSDGLNRLVEAITERRRFGNGIPPQRRRADSIEERVAAIEADIGPIEVAVYNLGAQIGDRALKDTSLKAFETGWRLGTFGLFRLASPCAR